MNKIKDTKNLLKKNIYRKQKSVVNENEHPACLPSKKNSQRY